MPVTARRIGIALVVLLVVWVVLAAVHFPYAGVVAVIAFLVALLA
jgi:hypothetical protein